MTKATILFFSILVFLILFFLNAPFSGNLSQAETDYIEKLSIFRFDEKAKAQNFILKNLNGSEISLEDYRGRIILINFWATWCLPCLIEMPSMEKLYAKFKNEGFMILAIDMQEKADNVKVFKEKYNLNFPILLDSDGVVGQFYSVRSIPTTYLLDSEGYLIGSALGARDWASENAFGLIDQLLKVSPNS